jgi:small subunit ribosomal protein S8
MSDPIADMICCVKNAQAIGRPEASVRASKLKEAIAKVLKAEGYISGYCIKEEGVRKNLILSLKYHHGKPVIQEMYKISKPGLRIYKKGGDLPKVMGGLGIAIVSTSKGVMADHSARALGEGGEILCYVS